MAEDKTPLPHAQVIVPLGHGPSTGSAGFDRILRRAERTFQAMYLPSGNSIISRWGKGVARIFVVRQSQRQLYSSQNMDVNDFTQVVMPDKYATCASDRREWIRTHIPLRAGAVRIQSDADFIGLSSNRLLTCDWWTDPMKVSGTLGIFVLHFQHYQYDFAGFNDHTNIPGMIPGMSIGRPDVQDGLSYFKEMLTFERDFCPGRYPKGWNFKEGAWRILDTVRRGGKVARYWPVADYTQRESNAYEHEDADEQAVQNLVAEFGHDVCMKRPSKGLNLGCFGQRRNRLRKAA